MAVRQKRQRPPLNRASQSYPGLSGGLMIEIAASFGDSLRSPSGGSAAKLRHSSRLQTVFGPPTRRPEETQKSHVQQDRVAFDKLAGEKLGAALPADKAIRADPKQAPRPPRPCRASIHSAISRWRTAAGRRAIPAESSSKCRRSWGRRCVSSRRTPCPWTT